MNPRGLRKYHLAYLHPPLLTLIHLARCSRAGNWRWLGTSGAVCAASSRLHCKKRSDSLFQLHRPRRGQAQQALAGLDPRNGAGAAGKVGAVCIAKLDPESLCIAQSIAPPRREAVEQLLIGGTESPVPYRRLCRQALHDIRGRLAVAAVLLWYLRGRLRP